MALQSRICKSKAGPEEVGGTVIQSVLREILRDVVVPIVTASIAAFATVKAAELASRKPEEVEQ